MVATVVDVDATAVATKAGSRSVGCRRRTVGLLGTVGRLTAGRMASSSALAVCSTRSCDRKSDVGWRRARAPGGTLITRETERTGPSLVPGQREQRLSRAMAPRPAASTLLQQHLAHVLPTLSRPPVSMR